MLNHFPRPLQDTGRGVHWSPNQYLWGKEDWGFWQEQFQAMNIKWVKLLDDGSGSMLGLVRRLADLQIMPVIRFYREQPNPGRISARETDAAKRYVEMGAVYFETNNEPDLDLEWKGGKRPANCLGRPLDYPNDTINTQGTPLTPQEWADKGGMWAWEMSYEAVNEQRRKLARPNVSIMEDSTCFRAFEYFDALVNQAVGHSIPIFTTEGGYNVGQRAGTTFGDDPRYPKPTPERMLQAFPCL